MDGADIKSGKGAPTLQDQRVQSDVAVGESFAYQTAKKSWLRRFLDMLRLEDKSVESSRWSNKDLDPVPPEQQTWRSRNYAAYWLCDAVAPGNLRLASSLVTTGLSWQAAIGAIALGHFLISLTITANGIIGARLHIPYTIQSRAPFGFYFSFVVVFIRMLVGFFWYGINTYTGAECVHAVLVAIWPSFVTMRNRLPVSANITSQMMIAYIVYFLIVLPFHVVHPRRLRLFFDAKVILCLPAMFGMLIWACRLEGNALRTPLMLRGSTVSGSAYSWAFLQGLNAMLGSYGTMAVNINDFARYAKHTRSVFIQILIIPLSFSLLAYMGVIIAGCASKEYGVEVWDPLTIMSHWTGSSKARAGATFCGLAFTLAQLGTNISANCISASNDLNAMFPRYINLRRGSYLIAFIGAWALTPWNILASASALLNFMDGYTIWLAPIAGILLADYWFVHRRSYNVSALYRPDARYRYNRCGTNWRAVLAFVVGWAPLLPGFAQAVSDTFSLADGLAHLYDLGYLYGFFVSGVVYWLLSLAFPLAIPINTDEADIQDLSHVAIVAVAKLEV
ncbi:NCS1 nucleoside transporter family [Teratosphaeria nubilosa]|uniref:NCS1 nucleoside transporter family n=1 Tax=Teratosphaeria nubilosa TaxID=161662 RepID=A0A6G1LC69_9PEZI|nr:NCS1 nucleoside transporter family [Teratosphaeria nubilosa]